MQKHSEDLTLKKIAVIRTDFPEKFGLPRQSGLAETRGKVVFEPEYRSKDALRGLEDYSHLWLLWGFSEVKQKTWHATSASTETGRKYSYGRICHKISVSTKSNRIVLRSSGENL